MPAYHWSTTARTSASHGIATGAPAAITTTVFGVAAAAALIIASWSSGALTQTGNGQTPGSKPSLSRSVPSDSLSAAHAITTSDALATASASACKLPSP